MDETNQKVEVILDIMEMKARVMNEQTLLSPSTRVALQNTTYSVLEVIIAHLLDKYKVDYSEIRSLWHDRQIKKELAKQNNTQAHSSL